MKAKITVFVNPSCYPCIILKEWLIENNIEFIEKDIINDTAASEEFLAIDGEYTPTTIIQLKEKNTKIIGANYNKIKRILNSESNIIE